MKVYFSNTPPELNGYTHITNPQALNLIVDQNEAEEIIVDNAASMFAFNELPSLFSLLISKMRIGSKLIIYYVDMDLISKQYENGSANIKDVNDRLFGEAGSKSVLNEDVIMQLLPKSFTIEKTLSTSDYKSVIVGVRNE